MHWEVIISPRWLDAEQGRVPLFELRGPRLGCFINSFIYSSKLLFHLLEQWEAY